MKPIYLSLVSSIPFNLICEEYVLLLENFQIKNFECISDNVFISIYIVLYEDPVVSDHKYL